MRALVFILVILMAGLTLKLIRDSARNQRNRAAIQRIIDARNRGIRPAPLRVRPDRPLTGAQARWEAARSR